MTTNNDWQLIQTQLNDKKLTPIISNRVLQQAVFGADDGAMQLWLKKIAMYPLADSNLSRVSQFRQVNYKSRKPMVKEYLEALNRAVLRAHPSQDTARQEQLKIEAQTRPFSDFVLHDVLCLNLDPYQDNPLTLLARLELPLYITTSPHSFIEEALKRWGKEPRTEVYAWREELQRDLKPEYRFDPDFEPSEATPLVYHLHGIDDCPDSLVLTEDDFLGFLVNVAQDIKNPDVVPSVVRYALSSSLLLLLGYQLHTWDLRVLLHGLIQRHQRRERSFTVQFVPPDMPNVTNHAEYCNYLQGYFEQTTFEVHWGDTLVFLQELWERKSNPVVDDEW
jgi:hypothetical protein